jgi:hypothetical protein
MSAVVTPRPLATVAETVRLYPHAFRSEPSLRWLIWSDAEFRRVCVRHVGRRVLIDLAAFEGWLDAGGSTPQPRTPQPTRTPRSRGR